MYGWSDLKEILALTADTVECPVKGCQQRVRRQRDQFRAETQFQCPIHGIYISPSTFEYKIASDNMLWSAAPDLALWGAINTPGVKRESRMARDNSEDAMTWNVFRYLEKHGLVKDFINLVAKAQIATNPQLIYWSFCQVSRKPWQPLLDAAKMFGESIAGRSEPDLIIDDDEVLAFVENKFGSGNKVRGKRNKTKSYVTGSNGWFRKVFKPTTEFFKIAVTDKLYELMRLWLLGSWIAESARKRFILVNVVRAKQETEIERRFGTHIQANDQRQFVRVTWEDIYSGIVQSQTGCPDAEKLTRYLKEKTVGYGSANSKGQAKLKRALTFIG